MDRIIIFYHPGLPSVSPAVSLWWPGKVINLFNLLPVEAWCNGNAPQSQCVDFIAACVDTPKIESRLEVWNLPLRTDRLDELADSQGDGLDGEPWRKWLFEEVERLFSAESGAQEPPVLVDLDLPYHVTQGGEVLCQRANWEMFEPGDPLWVTPTQAKKLEKARAAAVKRRKKRLGITVAEYETLLCNRLEAAGFDFDNPDSALARRVFLSSGWVPVECYEAYLYFETRDGSIEFGRRFQHGPDLKTARFERVGLRFSSEKLNGFEFESTAGYCMALRDKPAFSRMLREIFAGPEKLVSRWEVELRRFEERPARTNESGC